MAEAGLAATEFGPDGFLPSDPAVMAEFLASHHLTAVCCSAAPTRPS